ncbi:MAG: hypothetical protein KBD96_01875 [Brachymonas sp.]|nr:hypothetical protein [Brachymonas sp.]MBP6139165.1 hypothetical protein [Brachymonas sp.]MBP6966569.1 hypothetical protein [Brachymonas sp.]MBP7247105.1 hypothetical protein [Brachymonas sp.]MBP7740515.1 hypothetical protein [Brachymonas sp.]
MKIQEASYKITANLFKKILAARLFFKKITPALVFSPFAPICKNSAITKHISNTFPNTLPKQFPKREVPLEMV